MKQPTNMPIFRLYSSGRSDMLIIMGIKHKIFTLLPQAMKQCSCIRNEWSWISFREGIKIEIEVNSSFKGITMRAGIGDNPPRALLRVQKCLCRILSHWRLLTAHRWVGSYSVEAFQFFNIFQLFMRLDLFFLRK